MFRLPTNCYVLFLCFIILISQVITNTEATCHPDDEEGLLALKSGLKDKTGMLSGWIAGTNCCEWHGIYCEEGRVGTLSLSGYSSELSDTISPKLSKLQELYAFDVEFYGLTGRFPKFLLSLPKMQYISIVNTNLSGRIPEAIGNLRGLTHLILTGNQFSGKIPSSLGNTKLYWVDLSGNRLKGTIPPEIGQLPDLLWLDLSRNRLSGPIPNVFSRFGNLKYLYLNSNKLNGSIPESISKLPDVLFKMNLANNNLTGTIPDIFGSFPYMSELNLSWNSLSGPVPKSFVRLYNVYDFDLSHNHLCGPLPVTDFPASSFEANDCLCGAPLPPC